MTSYHSSNGRKQRDGTVRYNYRGATIVKNAFGRYETPGYRYGDEPGEHEAFKTMKRAKEFIDARIAERDQEHAENEPFAPAVESTPEQEPDARYDVPDSRHFTIDDYPDPVAVLDAISENMDADAMPAKADAAESKTAIIEVGARVRFIRRHRNIRVGITGTLVRAFDEDNVGGVMFDGYKYAVYSIHRSDLEVIVPPTAPDLDYRASEMLRGYQEAARETEARLTAEVERLRNILNAVYAERDNARDDAAGLRVENHFQAEHFANHLREIDLRHNANLHRMSDEMAQLREAVLAGRVAICELRYAKPYPNHYTCSLCNSRLALYSSAYNYADDDGSKHDADCVVGHALRLAAQAFAAVTVTAEAPETDTETPATCPTDCPKCGEPLYGNNGGWCEACQESFDFIAKAP